MCPYPPDGIPTDSNYVYLYTNCYMKLLSFVLLLFISTATFSQSLKKYPIGNTGCSAYAFCQFGDFDADNSEDSSKVFTKECAQDSTTYGIICVQLKTAIEKPDIAESVLISYLDFLKTQFKITSSAGYGKGHRLKDREDTRGVLDYWEDADKYHWKVKGWTDGKFIAVMYTYSKKELSETKINLFLDGFRLPGM